MSITYQYSVPDVVCGNCSNTVENVLRQAPYFKDQQFGVDPIEKKLTITFEEECPSYAEIRDVLNEILEPVGFSCVDMKTDKVRELKRWFSHRLLGAVGVSVGLLFIVLSMLSIGPGLMWLMTCVSFPLTLFLGEESYEKSWKKLKLGVLTMDSLFSLSTLSILCVSVAALFFPGFPMMCEAGLLIFGFRHLGLAIEQAFKNTQWMTQRFQDDAPSTVIRMANNQKKRVFLKSLQKKDVILLYPGDVLPVDGVFEEDDGLILDRIVTGSNMPRRIMMKEQLYAGTILTQATKPLRYRVTATALNSHLARLDAKIARAKLEKAAIESVANRILQYFIPTILVLAAISGVVISSVFSFALGIQSAVAVLVSACPCTLGLITPLAIKVGIKKAADAGVVFNSAKKLELADTADCVVFDLNGTLTQGKPVVMRYGVFSKIGLSAEMLLQLMGYFEEKCVHPVASSIRTAAARCLKKESFEKYEVISNDYAGRVLRYQGASYVIGSESLLMRQGIHAADILKLRKKLHLKGGESIVYLAKEQQLIGYVILKDALRKDAKTVISALKSINKQPYLCTGADPETAYEMAKQLGIPKINVQAHCVSHANTSSVLSKRKVIDDLRAKGLRVAAVGDGANDAEMIAAADVGFAISSGDAHTQQHAAAVIKGQSLLPVLHAFKISKHTVRNIRENLWFSLFYNVATVCLAAGLLLSVGVVLNPAVGAALMILQTSLIFLNVYRFVKKPVHTHNHTKDEVLNEAVSERPLTLKNSKPCCEARKAPLAKDTRVSQQESSSLSTDSVPYVVNQLNAKNSPNLKAHSSVHITEPKCTVPKKLLSVHHKPLSSDEDANIAGIDNRMRLTYS